MGSNNPELERIFSAFRTEARFRSAARIGSGHINDTYRITTRNPGISYVLQRINASVFKNIPGLMQNIDIVTRHLEHKINSGNPAAEGLSVLRLIPALNNDLYLRDEEGKSWRLYNFVEGTKSYDVVESPELAYKGGRAFGLFQYLASDIPAGSLVETIRFFHDIEKRLVTFHQVVLKDAENRMKDLSREIEFVEKREEGMKTILNRVKEGKIPLRVTHNDTKFNNILFDADDNAVCIVDLDTVMPGTVLYDFGDAIRTGANRATEDENDLEKVGIDLDLFRAYSKGYLETATQFLNEQEKSLLAFSARFMTFIIALRFLTDHIDGDHYYRIHFPGHNLQRARAQFRLLETMEEKAEEMEAIVKGR
jgi:Ser/Thr protein kinase RdoA (MazF antagonist)